MTAIVQKADGPPRKVLHPEEAAILAVGPEDVATADQTTWVGECRTCRRWACSQHRRLVRRLAIAGWIRRPRARGWRAVR